jgi:hypothetical protein
MRKPARNAGVVIAPRIQIGFVDVVTKLSLAAKRMGIAPDSGILKFAEFVIDRSLPTDRHLH